jgi:putative addiction module component (TIGR02574 family)
VARISLDQFLEMSIAERVEFAQAIWESVAQNPDDVPLTQAQREELDRRLEKFERNPNAGSTWELVRRSLRSE